MKPIFLPFSRRGLPFAGFLLIGFLGAAPAWAQSGLIIHHLQTARSHGCHLQWRTRRKCTISSKISTIISSYRQAQSRRLRATLIPSDCSRRRNRTVPLIPSSTPSFQSNQDQPADLFHLPSAARWLVSQRCGCSKPIHNQLRHRPNLPSFRRRYLPERRCLFDNCSACGLSIAVELWPDPRRDAHAGARTVHNSPCVRSL